MNAADAAVHHRNISRSTTENAVECQQQQQQQEKEKETARTSLALAVVRYLVFCTEKTTKEKERQTRHYYCSANKQTNRNSHHHHHHHEIITSLAVRHTETEKQTTQRREISNWVSHPLLFFLLFQQPTLHTVLNYSGSPFTSTSLYCTLASPVINRPSCCC